MKKLTLGLILGLLMTHIPAILPMSEVKHPNDPTEQEALVAKEFFKQQLDERIKQEPDPKKRDFLASCQPLDTDRYISGSLVPFVGIPYKQIATALHEQNNSEKYTSPEAFESWFNASFEHSGPYRELYADANLQATINKDSTTDYMKRFEKQDRQNVLAARGSIHHEIGHIINKDSHTGTSLDKAISSTGNALDCGTLLVALKKNLFQKGNRSGLILAGLFHLTHKATSSLTKLALDRKMEWRADESIPNNCDLLDAKAQSCTDLHIRDCVLLKNKLDEISRTPYHRNDGSFWIHFQNINPIANIFSDHPTPLARANRFKERSDALKAGQPAPPRQSLLKSYTASLLSKRRITPEIIAF